MVFFLQFLILQLSLPYVRYLNLSLAAQQGQLEHTVTAQLPATLIATAVLWLVTFVQPTGILEGLITTGVDADGGKGVITTAEYQAEDSNRDSEVSYRSGCMFS